MLKALVAGTWLLITSAAAMAADFYLHFENCKLTVGYLVLSNESLKVLPGDGSLTACTRMSQSIHCEFQFLGGAKGSKGSADYEVHIESPPILIFTDDKRADYYVIDQSNHAATLITRVLERQFAGAKVCQGSYFTESERREMRKSK